VCRVDGENVLRALLDIERAYHAEPGVGYRRRLARKLIKVFTLQMAETSASQNLSDLATSRFGTISVAEQWLFEATVEGNGADCTDLSEKDRFIRADCLVWLCTYANASALVTYRGILIIGAEIHGQFDLSWTKIPFPIRARSCVFRDAIDLTWSQVALLSLSGSTIKQLGADGARFAESVLLRSGFKAESPVHLNRATIGGDLDCTGGHFTGNENVPALSANGANIQGFAFFGAPFKAEGGVNLVDATIGKDLEINGGVFIGRGNIPALDAGSAKIDGSLFFRDHAVVDGIVNLGFTSIGRAFQWRVLKPSQKTTLNLSLASCGTLWHDQNSWPRYGNLRLYGFVYDQIDHDALPNAEGQLSWLRLQPRKEFLSQPYERLATVLRNMGLEEDARKVIIAKNEDHATHLSWHLDWLWYGLFGKLIGYGYLPWRAFFISLFLIVISSLYFQDAYDSGLITPTEKDAYAAFVEKGGSHSFEPYPGFNAFIYSLETFVPFLTFDVAKHWAPNPNRGSFDVEALPLPIRTGDLLRWYLLTQITAGYVLSALWVGGITGLVKT
jgi:hypothetical protein